MKKYLYIVVFFALASFKSDTLPKVFSELLTRTQLNFIMPEGMVETKCIENRQMNYEYALKYKGKNFEVRYAIRPMDSSLAQYERDMKQPGTIIIHPNKWSAASFQATLLNLGMGNGLGFSMPEINYFDSVAVKKEFNADWGATAFVNLGKDFGGNKYKYCIAVIIHKDFVGDAYFFYVSDNRNEIGALMEKPFHSLKFK